MSGAWLLYGANGYTGELIAREAQGRGLRPILGGRSAAAVAALAAELGLPSRIFDLTHPATVDSSLAGVSLVLNCAGPFSATAEPMLAACLRVGAHYLDITGEVDVFERAFAVQEQSRAAGIVVCPGVGFDVIPTDCLAARLARELPDATDLCLGFDSRGRASRGTRRTSIAGAGSGGRIRRDGLLMASRLGSPTRMIDFGDGPKPAVAIPWGDLATAYRTTGIANITVYVPTSVRRTRGLVLAHRLRRLLRRRLVQWLLRRSGPAEAGPTARERARTPSYVWGEVTNSAGERRVARIKTANGYDLTVHGSLAAVQRLLDRPLGEGGVFTPSQLFGADLVTSLPGSGVLVVDLD